MKIELSKISERKDFKTHLIYAERLAKLSHGLSIKCQIKPLLKKNKLSNIKSKLYLIGLTKKSLEDERRIVDIDREYSLASVLWLPIKTYYLLYHLLSVIDYILTGNKSSLSITHDGCLTVFSKRLKNAEIEFNEKMFNNVFAKEILDFRSKSGEHLRSSASDDVIFKLVMKKIGIYKKENYILKSGIDLRTKKGREKIEKYLSTKFTVSILNFFYLMRIKSSYKDFNFIDDMPAIDTKRYFYSYYTTADNFYSCFNNLKNKLIADISISKS